MTSATLNRNAPTLAPDPAQDVIAWMLSSSNLAATAVDASPSLAVAEEAARRTSDSAFTDHDMTPEFVAWVLGTGYAAGHLPDTARGASTAV